MASLREGLERADGITVNYFLSRTQKYYSLLKYEKQHCVTQWAQMPQGDIEEEVEDETEEGKEGWRKGESRGGGGREGLTDC